MVAGGVLETLRSHLKNGENIKLLNETNEIVDDITQAKNAVLTKDDTADVNTLEKFDISQETNFLIEDKPMELRVVIHCYMHKDSSITDYLADCQKKQLTNISFLQRNDLISWLSGSAETSQYLKNVTDEEGNKAETENENAQFQGQASTQPTTVASTETGLNVSDDKTDPTLFEALKHERQLLDHNSTLRGTKSIDFGYLIKDAELKLVQSIKSSIRGKSSNGHVSKNASASHKRSVQQKDPIILIPSAASSIITVANIKQFLLESNYINPREISVSLKDDLVTIEKKFDKIYKPIRFLVVNNTRMFTKPEYWDRVVAVFTTGHVWQFNNYQWNTPQELFQHCKGYYFYFNGEEVPQHVQQWNVQRVELDRNRRFKDVEIVRFFWNSLEQELLNRGFH